MILRKMRKGQMFLLGALVISSILVILRYHGSYPTPYSGNRLVDINMESKIIDNLAKEINNTIVVSYNEPSNITRNVFHFANFSEQRIIGRSLSLSLLHVGSISNMTTDELKVTVINKIGTTQNFSLSLDGQEGSLTLVDDSMDDVTFSITPSTSYDLVLSYASFSKTIPIKTRAESDIYFGYSLISFEGDSAAHVIDFQKDIYLN